MAHHIKAAHQQAPRRGAERPGKQSQRGRLPRPIRANESGDPAGGNRHRKVIEGNDVAEPLGDAFKNDRRALIERGWGSRSEERSDHDGSLPTVRTALNRGSCGTGSG